jgi:hypothetical protein
MMEHGFEASVEVYNGKVARREGRPRIVSAGIMTEGYYKDVYAYLVCRHPRR